MGMAETCISRQKTKEVFSMIWREIELRMAGNPPKNEVIIIGRGRAGGGRWDDVEW
jgi:hypothetical protein